jgi:hypothetical protein
LSEAMEIVSASGAPSRFGRLGRFGGVAVRTRTASNVREPAGNHNFIL